MIAVEVTSDSSIDEYYEGLSKLGTSPGGTHPDPACLFHFAIELKGGGWRVTDIWESKEKAEAFFEGKVMPVMQELGASRPKLDFIEVTSILTGSKVPAHA